MNDAIDFDRYDRIRPIRWTGQALELLDQRKLPFVVEYVSCADSDARRRPMELSRRRGTAARACAPVARRPRP